MLVKSQNAAHPVVGACEITRCRTYLDDLSTTYSGTSTTRVVCHLCMHRTRRNWPWCRVRWVRWTNVAEELDTNEHTNIQRK